jgi:CRP-like cAMP-binding protein
MSFNHKTGNHLLDALPPALVARLQPHLEPCELIFGKEIHAPGEPAEYAYFPTGGVISVIATMSDGASVEIGMVGSEGMFYVSVILGDDRPWHRAIVQLPGRALRMKTQRFRQEMQGEETIRTLLLRYTMATLGAIAQSAACNRLHMLEQRCARWLLSAHDHAGKDTFPMTHEFLAMMLGVRRAGVTVAAQSLQHAALIAYNHGTMSILDRAGLEAAACECYRTIQDEFDRLLKT